MDTGHDPESTDTPAPVPTDPTPAEQPAQIPGERPVEEPAQVSAGEPGEQPAGEPVVQPDRPAEAAAGTVPQAISAPTPHGALTGTAPAVAIEPAEPVAAIEPAGQAAAIEPAGQVAAIEPAAPSPEPADPVTASEPGVAAVPAPSVGPAQTPAPTPARMPTPTRMPRPAAMATPAALHRPNRPGGAPRSTATGPGAEPAAPPASDPHLFGRVDDDGRVFLRTPEGEIVVGQWAAGDAESGLAFFGRKYDDLVVEVDLGERRLRDGRATPEQTAAIGAKVREALTEPAFVGDLAGLVARLDALDTLIAQRREAAAAERAAAKAEALAIRERLVAEAESLAESTHWKVTGERFRTLLDEWKTAPRVDRGKEQELWKRFSHARSTFDKRRRQYFAQLDAQRKDAISVKEAIVAEAEGLSTSRDWTGTARAYRALMDRWKASPRAPRGDEDKLWKRFREAQDQFFGARNATLEVRDSGQRENLAAKEALVAEAEALLPVRDLRAAKAALRSIQERWEKVGFVPRGDRDRIEARLHRVEETLRRAESDEWRRTNPAARARAEETVAQFRASVERLEGRLSQARASGDARAIHEAESSLATTQALLAAAEGALAEFTG